MRIDIIKREDDIRLWISQHQSKAFMCRQLRCKPETLNFYLSKLGISYSGNMGGKGIKSDPKRLPIDEYLSRDWIRSHDVKNRLLEEGIKERKCEECGNEMWSGKPIPLELHHEDGDRFNWNIDNLTVLCPNCHALRPNNSGSNVGSYS